MSHTPRAAAATLLLAFGLAFAAHPLFAQADTPEAAGERYAGRLAAMDWEGMAGLAHPEALAQVRILLESMAGTSDGDQFLAYLLGAGPSDIPSLSDEALFAAFLRFAMTEDGAMTQMLSTATYDPVGVLMEGELAHAVMRVEMDMNGVRVSGLDVTSFRETEAGWKALLNGEVAGVLEMLRQALGQGPGEMLPVGDLPSLGSNSAPLVLVEFADYECPSCGQFFRQAFPALRAEYVDSGRILYMHADFPLYEMHPNALAAATAARCARAQSLFWPMHERMLTNQDALSRADLDRHAVAVGADPEGFRTCMASPVHEQAIRQSRELGARLGITGTPTLVLGEMDAATGELRVLDVLKRTGLADVRAALEGWLERVPLR